jgi:hypothetical protein
VKIDPSTSPMQFDFVHDNNGPLWQAIYSVDDDVFKLNYVDAATNEKRPAIFATSSGSGAAIVVMRKM